MPTEDPSSLGNLLMKLEYCTKHQVKEGLDAVNGTARLGDVLVSLDYLTKFQLEWALTYQEMERKQVNGKQVHAFIRQQHRELVDDLHNVMKGVRSLTAKINGKS